MMLFLEKYHEIKNGNSVSNKEICITFVPFWCDTSFLEVKQNRESGVNPELYPQL